MSGLDQEERELLEAFEAGELKPGAEVAPLHDAIGAFPVRR
jgi:hypothetical protein